MPSVAISNRSPGAMFTSLAKKWPPGIRPRGNCSKLSSRNSPFVLRVVKCGRMAGDGVAHSARGAQLQCGKGRVHVVFLDRGQYVIEAIQEQREPFRRICRLEQGGPRGRLEHAHQDAGLQSVTGNVSDISDIAIAGRGSGRPDRRRRGRWAGSAHRPHRAAQRGESAEQASPECRGQGRARSACGWLPRPGCG